MRIGNGKTNSMVKEAARGWQKRFADNNWGDCSSTNRSMTIIERFRSPAHGSRKKTLMIPGGFTILIKPLGELR